MLLQLQEYIKNRQIVSLRELATHFRAPPAAIKPILEQLIRKGRVQKVAPSNCSGCNQCGSETFELYQWRISNAIRSNDPATQ
ncbi:MAG: FeoC-like transcriptional regulator [Thermosynechococcus sp. Uc]|uniref:FeoC-like transcriptional regulator n=1 Tax=Thermosynechococcus sp. Uc TaxID=3034853 RepID=UPI0019DA3DFA|nr:FeoC-like transcriptional regulator [Thermosynechococcus sp. Uc]MDM7326884.1 FeoC-like transcriptional regulator [Thermosynechococcus sp. Uc]HIK24895.1 FeoC-like transcriptional regulator [Thermosynechococcus sp. M46_R2017_013]